MIISASRRTDIPAFFPEQSIQKILHIHKGTEKVDAVVFWTKNAEPMLPFLNKLTDVGIPFYFQYTVNDYPELEPNIPTLDCRIKTFQTLSDMIGKERVIWRFDPILTIPEKLAINKVMDRANYIADNIASYTETCVFSYLDKYGKVPDYLCAPTIKEQELCRTTFRTIKNKYNITVATCAELSQGGEIEQNRCIDPILLEKLGVKLNNPIKDPSQRWNCGCIKSVDIGSYRTCNHKCAYCYAK